MLCLYYLFWDVVPFGNLAASFFRCIKEMGNYFLATFQALNFIHIVLKRIIKEDKIDRIFYIEQNKEHQSSLNFLSKIVNVNLYNGGYKIFFAVILQLIFLLTIWATNSMRSSNGWHTTSHISTNDGKLQHRVHYFSELIMSVCGCEFCSASNQSMDLSKSLKVRNCQLALANH